MSLPVGRHRDLHGSPGTVDPAATGTLTNTVTVTRPGACPTPTRPTTAPPTSTRSRRRPTWRITKTDSADPVPPGDPLTYTLTITNAGPSDATAVTVDRHAAGRGHVRLLRARSPDLHAWPGVTLTCDLGPLAAGANATVTINVTVNARRGGILVNTATVSGSETDPDPSNNSASATTAVGAQGRRAGPRDRHVYDLAADRRARAGRGRLPHRARSPTRPTRSWWTPRPATSARARVPSLQRIGPDGTTVAPGLAARRRGPQPQPALEEHHRDRGRGPDDPRAQRELRDRLRARRRLPHPRLRDDLLGPALQQRGDADHGAGPAEPHELPDLGRGLLPGPRRGRWSATHPFSLAPKATLVLNTAACPGRAAFPATITSPTTAATATLSGKTVALEPATGFSFDSPLEPRPRSGGPQLAHDLVHPVPLGVLVAQSQVLEPGQVPGRGQAVLGELRRARSGRR